jgi:hypothetical protein
MNFEIVPFLVEYSDLGIPSIFLVRYSIFDIRFLSHCATSLNPTALEEILPAEGRLAERNCLAASWFQP